MGGNIKGNGGFTYMALLVAIGIIGVSTMVVGQTWRTISKIEKEKELLWRGHQYRQAIGRYYDYRFQAHGGKIIQGVKYYPSELRDLLEDPGSPATRRYIRKIYADPMTGADDWVLVRGAQGIIGVHSASDAKPIKTDNFDKDDLEFKDKTRYSEWIFRFLPNQQ